MLGLELEPSGGAALERVARCPAGWHVRHGSAADWSFSLFAGCCCACLARDPLLPSWAPRGGDAAQFAFTEPLRGKPGADFSFSGLKTAVRLAIEDCMPGGAEGAAVELTPAQEQARADIAAGFQAVAVRHLCARVSRGAAWAMEEEPGVRDLGGCGAGVWQSDTGSEACPAWPLGTVPRSAARSRRGRGGRQRRGAVVPWPGGLPAGASDGVPTAKVVHGQRGDGSVGRRGEGVRGVRGAALAAGTAAGRRERQLQPSAGQPGGLPEQPATPFRRRRRSGWI